jgi:ferredoxin
LIKKSAFNSYNNNGTRLISSNKRWEVAAKTTRKIVRIDEEYCTGCGACVNSCAEGALELVDGKARLVSEKYCDGLAACLPQCPHGAIIIEEREADAFDEEKTKQHLEEKQKQVAEYLDKYAGVKVKTKPEKEDVTQESQLRQWPVQLALVAPGAPYLNGAELLLTADCVPFAYAGFHRDFLKGHSLLVACPKLDDFEAHLAKLTAIMRKNDLKNITVVRMEVPCCSGLVHLVHQAMQLSGKTIPFFEIVISSKGQVIPGKNG